MSSVRFEKAKKWFEELRNNLVLDIEKIDNKKFIITNWDHKDEGGGTMSKIQGKIIEKGGVNISTVAGKFGKNMRGKVPGIENNSSYKATGISVVLHPQSPHIPSMHFNTRFLETEKEWFGGGMDITPCLNFKNETNYHFSLESLCKKYNTDYYTKFKKWCDEYFYLPHRNEPRGIGGIFFDYLDSDNWEKDFDFVQEVGNFFHQFSLKTIIELKDLSWSEDEKNKQLLKRSRYVEFNLLHDRGTKFGLETGGNIDAILMSMPPLAKWE